MLRQTAGRASRGRRALRAWIPILFAGTLLLRPAGPAGAEADRTFNAQFTVSIRAGDDRARAGIRISQRDGALRTLRLTFPPGRFDDISADGRIALQGDDWLWQVPRRGGELRYRVLLTHLRNAKGHDALVTPRWAIFRSEDVFPAAEATLLAGSRGRSELRLSLPAGWTSFTPYQPDPANRLIVTPRGRAYERPVGWILAGTKLGSRKDDIGPMTVRIAAPAGGPVPRVPALALLRWTLPVLQAELDDMPGYLLVVMADDPMWRGGLSAPNSLYFHADRPLISENGTSTLVHEIMHVLVPVPAMRDHDWIDEGIAEYLGLVVLARSGTISAERFDHAVEVFRRRGASVRSIITPQAAGAVRARAVAIFSDVDRELQARSAGKVDIFDLVRTLMREQQPADLARLRQLAANLNGGQQLSALSPGRVPGGG